MALPLQFLVARLLPPIGLIFYLPTLMALSILEDSGFPTLQGSPDGWPIPTKLGLYAPAAMWWLFWSCVIAVVMWWNSRNKKKYGSVRNAI